MGSYVNCWWFITWDDAKTLLQNSGRGSTIRISNLNWGQDFWTSMIHLVDTWEIWYFIGECGKKQLWKLVLWFLRLFAETCLECVALCFVTDHTIWQVYFPPGWPQTPPMMGLYIFNITWHIITHCLCQHFLSSYSMFQFGCILIRNGLCCFKKCLWHSYFPGNLCKHSWLEGVFFLDTCRWHWVEFPLLCWQRVFDMIASLSIRHVKVTIRSISHIFCERHPHFLYIIRHTHRGVLQHSKLQNPHTLQMPTSPKPGWRHPAGTIYLSLLDHLGLDPPPEKPMV